MLAHKDGLLGLFAGHRVASNLLMGLMILVGLWSVERLNTQFFPSFELEIVSVRVVWPGASAEDVQLAITVPIEQELKGISGIKKSHASSYSGISDIYLEVEGGNDIGMILDDVKQAVASVRNMPLDSETPAIKKLPMYEPIAKFLLSGTETLDELKPLAYRFEKELLERGVRKINFSGLPKEELAIEIPAQSLHDLKLSLTDVAGLIAARSQDLPAGMAGRKEGSPQVRSLHQQREVSGFQSLPLLVEGEGRLVRLGDVAQIERRPKEGSAFLSYQGKPAIEFTLMRTKGDDTLDAARVMHEWYEQTQAKLPENIDLIVFDESWSYLRDRINLLLKNGLGGLALVIAILFLFLNVRVAWWVTVGIPVSFLAALAVLYVIGGTINLISLFGLIMTLGIIVDDAIVVGENTLSRVQKGEPSLQAAIGGARRMMAPVVASSLTTIAAFLPLFMIGGTMGDILIDIPTVVICVIMVSLVECFLILPGHLNHGLKLAKPASGWRKRIDQKVDTFREEHFRVWVTAAIRYRGTTITAAIAVFVVALSLFANGVLKFTFFPTIDSTVINASVKFSPGSAVEDVDAFLEYLQVQLAETEEALDASFVEHRIVLHRQDLIQDFTGIRKQGDVFGALKVIIVDADRRTLTNRQIIDAWQARIELPAGVETFNIAQQEAGMPGKPIEIKLVGDNVHSLKAASVALQAALMEFEGVSNANDSLPYGREQLIYELRPQAQAMGLTLAQVGGQLRAALEGIQVQMFRDSYAEVEVRVVLPKSERDYLNNLRQLPYILPTGEVELMDNLLTFSPRQGMDSLYRLDGDLATLVTADLDDSIANSTEIIRSLSEGTFEAIEEKYAVRFSFEGRSAEEQRTISDMKQGLFLALLLIFVILCWVFSSYTWPIAVMLAIPFGITGAIFGHLIMGMDMTILSMFGLFGLSGIVINDSIVLISFYRELREKGMAVEAAIVEAACQRLRAVLLTSLTTIAGLTPILFETSLQAQFLIPMATSIVFGLGAGTLLILLVVPALLVSVESITARLKALLPFQAAEV